MTPEELRNDMLAAIGDVVSFFHPESVLSEGDTLLPP